MKENIVDADKWIISQLPKLNTWSKVQLAIIIKQLLNQQKNENHNSKLKTDSNS